MFEEKQINVNNINIAYKQYTGNSNKTLICLHGWLDNAASFDLLTPYLSNYTVIALDLPGHGKSAHLPQANFYHFIDGISHLVAIIEALDIHDYVLVGHSLGACISSMAAAVLDERLSSMILIDAIGPLSSDAEDSAEHFESYLQKLPLIQKKRHRYYQSVDDASHIRARQGYLTPELTKIIVERGLVKTEKGYHWAHDDRLLLPSPLRMTEEQVLPFLANIKVPTLLITAEKGFQYDKSKAQKRIETVPNLTHIMLSGGHHIHMESPELCAQKINDFLDTHP